MIRSRMAVGLGVGLVTVMAAAYSTAGDSSREQAKEEMTFGLNAAKRGYWLEALSRFERANELVPGMVNVLNNIAVALEAAGRFEEAMVTYETAIEIAPNDRVLRRNFTQFREFYDEYLAPPTPEKDQAPAGAAEGPAESAEESTGDDESGN